MGTQRELRKALSDAIRKTVRTELGVREGERFPVEVFDKAAEMTVELLMVVAYLTNNRKTDRDGE